MKPIALDLFCKAGGATKGLQRAGFYVVGVDIEYQPHYCGDAFVQADALSFHLKGFDFIWASPMCQAHSWAARRWRKAWPHQIEPIRNRLVVTKTPFVIENVPGSPLFNPIILCGEMFGLNVIRHRHFEAHFPLIGMSHVRHRHPIMIRGKMRSAYCCVAGHGGEGYTSKLEDWREAMGIHWMTKEELVEAVPPAYAEFIGKQAMQIIKPSSNLNLELSHEHERRF